MSDILYNNMDLAASSRVTHVSPGVRHATCHTPVMMVGPAVDMP